MKKKKKCLTQNEKEKETFDAECEIRHLQNLILSLENRVNAVVNKVNSLEKRWLYYPPNRLATF